jgi:hypothetical protein
LPPNQRLERTGARPARHGGALMGAGRSTVGRYAAEIVEALR